MLQTPVGILRDILHPPNHYLGSVYKGYVGPLAGSDGHRETRPTTARTSTCIGPPCTRLRRGPAYSGSWTRRPIVRRVRLSEGLRSMDSTWPSGSRRTSTCQS